MQCPYCAKEMQKGEILATTGGLIWWQPLSDYGISWLRYTKKSIKKHGGILLRNWYARRRSVSMFQCVKCNKIVIDYEPE